MTPEDRREMCHDYLQRYNQGLLNDYDLETFRKLRLINSALSASFVVIIPYALINSFSVKYNFRKYYPKVLNASLIGLVFGIALVYNGKK